MKTNVLNNLSNVVKKGTILAGSAAAAVDSCAAGSTTLAEYPGNHPVITQLSPRNHPLLDAIWKHVAMIFAVLVMSIANIGMAWGAYTPTADEVIVFNEVYNSSATDAGYSDHAAIAWGGTGSTNSMKAGDPSNNGAATSGNVTCYSVKGNGKGKNITVSITGCSKIIVYHQSHSSRYVRLHENDKDGTVIGSGTANTYYTEVNLTPATAYTIFLEGWTGSDQTDFYVYAVKLIKASSCAAADLAAANITSNGDQIVGTGITFSKVGSPASGDTWYWQTSATGTDKTYNASSPYTTATTAGSYTVYLRAYNTAANCWGTAASMTNTIISCPFDVYNGENVDKGNKTASGWTINSSTNMAKTSGSSNGYSYWYQAGSASNYVQFDGSIPLVSGDQIKIQWTHTNSSDKTLALTINGSSASLASGSTAKNSVLTEAIYNVTSATNVTSIKLNSSGSSGCIIYQVSIVKAACDDEPSCEAPSSVGITGTSSYLPGQNISLTAAATGGSGTPTTYQWYHRGVAIDGATSATYTKSKCTIDDAGNYTCKVTMGGSCSTTSPNFAVRVYSVKVWSNGGGSVIGNYPLTYQSSNNGRAVISTLSASTTYEFKVIDNVGGTSDSTIYYGNGGTIHHNTAIDPATWDFGSTTATNCKLVTGVETGDFTFDVDITHNGTGAGFYVTVNVAYPTKTIYLTPGVWNAEGAKFAIHYYDANGGTGWTDFLTANDCGMSSEIPVWDGVKMIAGRFNSTKASTGNWDDKWNQTNDITVSSYNSVVITGWNEGDYTYNSNFSTPTYTISYNAGTGGSGSKASESKTCGVDFTLPGSTFTYAGHTQDGWATADGGAIDYALSGSYTTNDDEEFFSHWKCNTPTITDNGDNTVTITVPAGTTVRYTTDGTNPTSSTGTVYSSAFTIDATVTVKAIAYQSGCTDSEVASQACTYHAPVAVQTALVANTLYEVPDMIPSGASLTTGDQFFEGLSANTKFELIGSASNSKTPKVNNDPNNDRTIDGITFDDGSMWFKGVADLSSNIPTTYGLSFIVPEGGGKLYLYFSGTSTNIKLAKSGSSGSKPSCPNGYGEVDVTAGTYYLYGTGTTAPYCFYGLKLVVCTTPATTFGNGAYTVGGSALDLSTLISGKQGSGAITYTVKNANGTGATIAGTSFTATSAGTATVTATQAADATYCEKVMDATITVSAAAGHTVTYKYNGATSGATPTSATGTSVTLPTPARTDYTFDGWYTTEGTKVGNGDATYNPTADITLYARWQEACDAEGVAKSTADVPATGYTTYQEVGGSNVVFTSTPSLGFKYKDADGNTINSSTTAVVRNNAYSCQIKSSSSNKGSIKTNNAYSNVDSISFYFAGSDKAGCKVAVWCSTDDFSADSTQLLPATAVASPNGNKEFTRKVIAIPSGKKASALRFKFRFTADGSGKTCYMDSLKVYSSTSGGGTCYHVYYHGNGAESGFVSDTTSYSDGAKATVLSYNDSRYPLTKDGNDFQGWATSAGGSAAYSDGEKITIDGADVHLYAKWATASLALVTWKMKTADNEAWATTTGTGTTDETNISSIGTSHDEGDNKAKNSATAKTAMASGEVSSTAAPDKSARFTFTIGATKQVEINKFDCQVFNVSSGSRTYKAQISDEAGNVYNSTNTVPVTASATLTDASFVFGSGKILRGDVTIRVYAWGSGSEFRMGPDVKFYGTVQDYACATPSAPTISGVSEYVPGQTITLTASHDGENYDNLTTYTWYKGADWATASGTTPVQDAAMGESGYTLTIAATGNAGLYWCEVANGTCTAHSAAGYDVIVFPAYTITYHLDGGSLDGTQKTTYTQFDEDYTLPTPTKTGSVFAGWYGASDFSGLPTVVLGSGSVGNKEYWAKWGETVTVSWTVTKVDGKLYRGGGGYSVKAVINETDWSAGFMDELELTATEGVTLKNIEVSENGESKVQVTAEFDITTDLAADATSITFTLNVPADGKYGPKVDEHEETLASCGGGFDTGNSYVIGKSNSDATNISSSAALRAYKTASDWYSKGNTTFTDKTSTDGFTISAAEKSYYWQNNGTFTESSSSNCRLKTIKLAKSNGVTIRWTNDELSFSKVRFIGRNTAADDPTTFTVSNGTTEKTFTFEAGNSEIQTKEVTMDFVSGDTKGIVISGGTKEINILIELIPTSVGGVTPTLTWDDGDADIANDGVSKSTSNDDFVYTARQDKNSLGAITYSSSDATVATVNATTGQVHLVGAAGTATITATIAASGCFSSANVSYTITVTDDCDDEAGTIETEDLGCPGIKMTVKGHTAAAGVIYQWYKVGTPSDETVGTNQDNFTATEAGSYYVIVTNTGDRHCAKRSTNTITVEAQAAATVTKIVDSWYVKNGRRTPDIALVKTTNATSFTVTSGSSTIWESAGSTKTGFGGCGFHMDENGIIYLNGTKDGGAATTGLTAGDETLTITAIGCGSSASQTITIHCQAATNYKEIAFVVDGEKGKGFDKVTSGHADGTDLYEYLDTVGTAAGQNLFHLTERNIYSTTDEKAIREEYSQFDAILITDDPSTNTVVKTGDDYKTKGYVNAFGTMVDVRPIFTMEAYVSALKNWGAKGIAGNPESPNPRQYEMRLECKDHEIYGAGLPTPEDGTNVWEEVIDGETFRHVILVDSTLGIYKGVAYNAQTAGKEKPALQGFTGEAAGSLLGLGRISNGSLQAAIERQEEPAARLLVMGINAKALQPTCALTDEGKTVIKNILVYLLKTNMEEVDDCSNYFTGKTDSDWKKAENWSKNQLPSSEAKVRILAPCVISGIQPHVLQVSIVNSGNSNIRNTARGSAVCDGTLTIEPDGALIADGKIRSAVAPHFAANDLMPTTPEMLTINTRSDAQAALIFNNEEGLTKATVNLYSLGRNDGSYKYQYFAIPMEYVSVSPAFANETHGGTKIYTYVYNEASSGWTRRGYYDDLYAFEGLGITTKSTGAMNYTMTGTLASTATKEITLTHDNAGLNLIGNSWMAPIQIGALAEDNTDDNITKTVYIYCAGRDIVEGAATSGVTETAGQWLAVPFSAAEFPTWKDAGKLSVIPAMQAFEIKVSAEATLTLDYDKVVRGSTNDLNAKLRAPRRRVAAKEVTMTNIRVSDSKTHTDLSLFEGERFSDEFDNGWEAEYMNGDGRSAKLYAETVDGKMAVVAMTDYEGTMVGFAPGQERVYIFSFMGADNGYYLNDIKMQQSVRISEGETYSFTYEDGDDANRFMISRTPFEKPGVATGTENIDASVPQARKILYNDKLYIIRGGHMYDATGKMVK